MNTHGTASTHRHHDRNDLTGEHRIGDGGQLVLALVFFGVWIADTFFFRATTQANGIVPLPVRLAAGLPVVAFAGWLARHTTGIVFGEVRETPAVIRKGIYRSVRHPMYLSEILLYLGLLIMSMSVSAAIIWLGAIGFFFYLCRYEEKLLIERFGDEYRRYMSETGMWVPPLTRRG